MIVLVVLLVCVLVLVACAVGGFMGVLQANRMIEKDQQLWQAIEQDRRLQTACDIRRRRELWTLLFEELLAQRRQDEGQS